MQNIPKNIKWAAITFVVSIVLLFVLRPGYVLKKSINDQHSSKELNYSKCVVLAAVCAAVMIAVPMLMKKPKTPQVIVGGSRPESEMGI